MNKLKSCRKQKPR